jgi:hypothetical protein
MTERKLPVSPRKIPFPADLEYDNITNYRQHSPTFSVDTSSDKDKPKSGKVTTTNVANTNQLVDLRLFTLLDDCIKMEAQATGGNAQQIGD